uniref:Putative secreted protein n=1 Tax=Xenopsylla cheopis TaxID=163159 RepID=A0A6M2E3Y6_XENCH
MVLILLVLLASPLLYEWLQFFLKIFATRVGLGWQSTTALTCTSISTIVPTSTGMSTIHRVIKCRNQCVM